MEPSAPRRRSFAKELHRNARFIALGVVDTYGFQFRRRYNLPPTDRRFLAATDEEMMVDYWAHRFMDDPKLRDEMVDPDFDDEVAAMEAEMQAAQRQEAPPETPPAPETIIEAPPDPDDWEDVVSARWSS